MKRLTTGRKFWLLFSVSIAMIIVYALLYAFPGPVQAGETAAFQLADTVVISDRTQQGYDPQRTSFNPDEWKLGWFNAEDLDVLWTDTEGVSLYPENQTGDAPPGVSLEYEFAPVSYTHLRAH